MQLHLDMQDVAKTPPFDLDKFMSDDDDDKPAVHGRHDPALVLYITREELSEMRKGFAQFALFMQQQGDLNRHFMSELKELRGEVQDGEDTQKNLQIEELRAKLNEKVEREKNEREHATQIKIAFWAALVAIAMGLVGGGCSVAAAWMSYTQPHVQTSPQQGK